jgi:hypothetical protein
MATQTSTLILAMVNGITGPAKDAMGTMNALGLSARNLTNLMRGLGIGLSAYGTLRFAWDSLELFAAEEKKLQRLASVFKTTMADMQGAHQQMFDIAQKTASTTDSAEAAMLRLGQAGYNIKQSLEMLPGIMAAAKAGYGDAEKLATLTPQLTKDFRIAGDNLKDAYGSIVAASKGMIEGEKAFDILVDNLHTAMPLMSKLGWSGVEGLNKYLGYVRILSSELGGAEAGSAAMQRLMAAIYRPSTTAAFHKAFTKAFDWPTVLDQAIKQGKDPLKVFVEWAQKAANVGHPVLTRPKDVAALEILKRRGSEVRGAVDDIGEEAKTSIGQGLAGQLGTVDAKLIQLRESWKMFREELGATLVSLGVDAALDATVGMLRNLIVVADKAQEIKAREGNAAAIRYVAGEFAKGTGRFIHGLEKSANEALGGTGQVNIPEQKPASEYWSPTAATPTPVPRPMTPEEIAAERAKRLAEIVDKFGGERIDHALDQIEKLTETPPERPVMPIPPPAREVYESGEGVKPPRAAIPNEWELAARFGGAGTEAGNAFNTALDAELAKAEEALKARAENMRKALSFSATPTIKPQGGDTFDSRFWPGGRTHAGPGWLSASRRRGSHSDAALVPTE